MQWHLLRALPRLLLLPLKVLLVWWLARRMPQLVLQMQPRALQTQPLVLQTQPLARWAQRLLLRLPLRLPLTK